MTVFADTSALFALLDSDDQNHEQARLILQDLLAGQMPLLTSNYVLLETSALVQHRLGMEAVRDLEDALVPIFSINWVTESLHQLGVRMWLTANRRRLSLVDCTSFAICQQSRVTAVFAFDQHFAEQGFQLLAP